MSAAVRLIGWHCTACQCSEVEYESWVRFDVKLQAEVVTDSCDGTWWCPKCKLHDADVEEYELEGDELAKAKAYQEVEQMGERARACVAACAGIANFPENGLKAAMLDSAFAWEKAKHERDILEAALRKVCQQPFTPSTNGERWDEGFEKGWRAAMDGAYSIVRRALEEATK